jgi:hypothetical protein
VGGWGVWRPHRHPTPARRYFKEGGNTGKGALLLWEPMPEVFPDGLTPWLGLPVALHNRYFAVASNYSANYTFLTEPNATLALPIDK